MSKQHKNRPKGSKPSSSSSSSSSSRRSLLDSDNVSARASEKHEVFNSIGFPIEWKLPVPSPTQEFWAVSTFDMPAFLVSSVSVESDTSTTFAINNINASELAGYQALFDQYKIRWIELMLLPRTVNTVTAVTNFGRICTAIDFDSAAANSFANLETFTNSVTTAGNVSHYRAFKPCVSVAVGASNSASALNALSVMSPWLDLTTLNTPHYAFKCSQTVTDVVYTSDLIVRFHMAFRQKI